MMEVFVGIDVGTQGTKAIAYQTASPSSSSSATNNNNKGQILARASASYSILPTDVAGRAEQDTNDWIDAVRSVLKDIVSELDLSAPSASSSSPENHHYVLAGIGISGQQHGMVLLDSNFQPVRPAKLWCDVEASEESDWIRSFDTKQINSKGNWDHIVPSFTSPKVLWTMRNEPQIWDKVRWVVLPHDYINLVMRGVHDDNNYGDNATIIPTTDRGDASGSGVFDPVANEYCMDLVNAIDPTGRYARSLPKILEPLEICGNLSLQWMKDIGLLAKESSSIIPRIPISVGSGDNMCSALGVGCVRPGMAVLSLGTSGTIFGVSHSSPTSAQVSPFADACGRYLPLVCVMSCTGVLQSILSSFFNGCEGNHDDGGEGGCSGEGEGGDQHQKKTRTWTHDDATNLAMQHPPGCYGITFLPYLTPGERTPDWPHASGAILGLTASNMSKAVASKSVYCDEDYPPANPMAGLIYRAAMEGITYLLAEGISTMKEACGDGFKPNCMLVVGGGSQNKLWRQMLADTLGMELRFPKEKESAALGAAFQAGAAARTENIKTQITMDEYISKQAIEMEDEVVLPCKNEETLQLYRDGRERYCRYATKLFAGSR